MKSSSTPRSLVITTDPEVTWRYAAHFSRLIARAQFPAAAAQILQDLRLQHGDARRRFSTPAISTMEDQDGSG